MLQTRFQQTSGIRNCILAPLLLALTLGSCRPNNSAAGDTTGSDSTAAAPKTIPAVPASAPALPAGYTLIEQARGDLNGDGSEELVIACSLPEANEPEPGRRLMIFKAGPGGWERWHESNGPLMPGDAGGVSGDPFQGLAIENGSIVIRQGGGSRNRWDYVHRYRLNGNRWELAEASIAIGDPCDEFSTLEYRPASGDVKLDRTNNACDESGTEVPGQAKTSTNRFKLPETGVPMDGFQPGENRLAIPEQPEEFYY